MRAHACLGKLSAKKRRLNSGIGTLPFKPDQVIFPKKLGSVF